MLAGFSQTGKISGKIKDGKNNEILVGASVVLRGQAKGVSTSVEGTFVLTVPTGIHTLEISYSGFQTKTITDIEVKAGELTEIEVSLENESKEISGVTVTSTARKESINSLYNYQRTQSGMSDGIAADIIRKSPDRNTGAILKRVSGASVQENKFVVVRGLADRYNTAMINSSVLPSSEPDRKAFSFDIIPSNLVDNIIINKTASPDLPGDFSGGMVQVNTKDVPAKNFITLTAGLGVNTLTTFKDFKAGAKGDFDFLGLMMAVAICLVNFRNQEQNIIVQLPSSRLLFQNHLRIISGYAKMSQQLPCKTCSLHLEAGKICQTVVISGPSWH